MGEINPRFLLGGYAHATTLCFLPSFPSSCHLSLLSLFRFVVVSVRTLLQREVVLSGEKRRERKKEEKPSPDFLPLPPYSTMYPAMGVCFSSPISTPPYIQSSLSFICAQLLPKRILGE